MTYEEIEEEIEDFEGDVFFVSILNQFVWSPNEKKVVGYHEQSTKMYPLVVMDTEPVDVSKIPLKDYLTKQGVTSEDVLVFCINPEFYPKRTGDWVLISILKKINKVINQNRTERKDNGKGNDISRISSSSSEDDA